MNGDRIAWKIEQTTLYLFAGKTSTTATTFGLPEVFFIDIPVTIIIDNEKRKLTSE